MGLSNDHHVGGMGTVSGNKYAGDEREVPGTNTSGSMALSVTRGFSNSVSFSFSGRGASCRGKPSRFRICGISEEMDI